MLWCGGRVIDWGDEGVCNVHSSFLLVQGSVLTNNFEMLLFSFYIDLGGEPEEQVIIESSILCFHRSSKSGG